MALLDNSELSDYVKDKYITTKHYRESITYQVFSKTSNRYLEVQHMKKIILAKRNTFETATERMAQILFDKALENSVELAKAGDEQLRSVLFMEFLDGQRFRDDTRFIAALESLGSTGMKELFAVVDIPDDVIWCIAFDPMHEEYIKEVHREWHLCDFCPCSEEETAMVFSAMETEAH